MKSVTVDMITEIVRQKLPTDSPLQTSSIKLECQEVLDYALIYTNRDGLIGERGELPEILKNTLANIVIDILNSKAINGLINDPTLGSRDGSLTTIKDGDTQLSWGTGKGSGAHIADLDKFFYNYENILSKYRISRW